MVKFEYLVILNLITRVYCNGLLLLYRPKDITKDCSFSTQLRYDISYGMGMSDTITLVFRTLPDIDYECQVLIVPSTKEYLIVVVRYPTTIQKNCAANKDALTVLKKWKCTRLCDLIERDVQSPYLIFYARDRIRLLFKSNSSINEDLKALFYQVTVTSARAAPKLGCSKRNETLCIIHQMHFCFTSGVVCDGIKNCGVDDWFDERKSYCTLPVQRLTCAPVVAVMAVLLCVFVAGGHSLLRCLPELAQSFFIFNANEDNRLCIDPLLVPNNSVAGESSRPPTVIPVNLSSDSESDIDKREEIEMQILPNNGEESLKEKEIIFQSDLDLENIQSSENQPEFRPSRKNPVITMKGKIHEKLKLVSKYAKRRHPEEKPKIIVL